MAIVRTCIFNKGALAYITQIIHLILAKRPRTIITQIINKNGETDSKAIIVKDFNTPFTSMTDYLDRKSVRKHWPK